MELTLIITAAVAAVLLLIVIGWISVSSVSRQIESGLPKSAIGDMMPPENLPERRHTQHQPRCQRQENMHHDIMAASIVIGSASDCSSSTESNSNGGDL